MSQNSASEAEEFYHPYVPKELIKDYKIKMG
jgi:hypothetical protein